MPVAFTADLHHTNLDDTTLIARHLQVSIRKIEKIGEWWKPRE
jgi:hypothetical protein